MWLKVKKLRFCWDCQLKVVFKNKNIYFLLRLSAKSWLWKQKTNKNHMVFLTFVSQAFILAVLYAKSVSSVATVQQKWRFRIQKLRKSYGFWYFFAEHIHFDHTVNIFDAKVMILTRLSAKSCIQNVENYVWAETVS